MIANRLQQPQRPDSDHVGGIFGLVERNPHMRLRGEIVDLVRQRLLDYAPQPGGVAEVSIMQSQG